MIAVFKKELRAAYTGLLGYALSAFYLLFAGVFVTMNNLYGKDTSIETTYSYILFALLMIIPVLTMRSLAEERQNGTNLLLSSLPIRTLDYVLGKYLALLVVLAIPIWLVGSYSVILSFYGNVRPLSAILVTFALFLVAASMTAIGLFISSITSSVMMAAVLTLGALLLIYYLPALVILLPATALGSFLVFTILAICIGSLIGYFTKSLNWGLLTTALLEGILVSLLLFSPTLLEGSAAKIIGLLSLTSRFELFSLYGLFDLSAVFYFLSMCFLFIYFTVASVEKRRWN
ncbi:MAG: ABC transporter permease [Clostridia bacterium]|nr:ABC transporter permease [Clostridia bacterium]